MVAKDELASAMTEGSVGLPSPDLQVHIWDRSLISTVNLRTSRVTSLL